MTQMKKMIALLIAILLLFPLAAFAGAKDTYEQAQELLAQSNYSEAANLFDSISSYEDSFKLSMYCKACALCEAGLYDLGIQSLQTLGDFKDCPYRITYYTARSIEDSADANDWKSLEKALDIYMTIPVFLDSINRISALSTRIDTIKNTTYDSAILLADEGKYAEAMAAFTSLGGYKDSTSRAKSALRKAKIKSFVQAEPGSFVTFGLYEQDGNFLNGPEEIEWIVLENSWNKLTLISRFALDIQPYNNTLKATTWETCTLRTWLNNDFLCTAFNSVERDIIVISAVNNANPKAYFDTIVGNNTKDKIYLLSTQECSDFFPTEENRKCLPTPYAKQQGALLREGDTTLWWLRTIGYSQIQSAYVAEGEILVSGAANDSQYITIRPVLKVDLMALNTVD